MQHLPFCMLNQHYNVFDIVTTSFSGPTVIMPSMLLVLLLQFSLLSLSPIPTMATTAPAPGAPPLAPQHLNLTAISAKDGASILECWQLKAPLITSSEPGTVGAASTLLGATQNTTYSILPPKFDGGLHNAPAVQYVIFTLSLPTLPFLSPNQSNAGPSPFPFRANT